jgi:hypothetical protein
MPVASLEAELDAARVSGVAADFRARQEEDHPIPIDMWGEGRRRWEAERKRREQGRGRTSDGYAVGGSSQPAWAPGREDRRSPERSQQPYGRCVGSARRTGAPERAGPKVRVLVAPRSRSVSSATGRSCRRRLRLLRAHGRSLADRPRSVGASAEAPKPEEALGRRGPVDARPASDPPRPNKEPARKGPPRPRPARRVPGPTVRAR